MAIFIFPSYCSCL